MKKQPTPMQAKALELIREGTPPVKAMREAGYSEETSRSPKQNLLGSAGARSVIEEFKAEYLAVGITQSYMAAKTAQWLEAKKPIGASILVAKGGKLVKAENEGAIEVDDYQTQLKAAEFWRRDIGLLTPTDSTPPLTQNNYFNLTDEQLDQLISAKLRQVGVGDALSGKGEAFLDQSAEASSAASETTGSQSL